MKVVLAKMGLDGHDKGLKIVAKALVEEGVEVVYLGLHQNADTIVATALQEGASAIGVSILSGVHLEAAQELLERISITGCTDVKVCFGGTIPDEDIPILEKMGVDKIFQVETKLEEIRAYYMGKDLKQNISPEKKEREYNTASAINVKEFYTSKDLRSDGRQEEVPGEYPYTRGPYESMYRGRVWTMRQYAGFGTAGESNQRYKYLLSQGQTGLSVALDLPTQMGFDSDNPLIAAEVGKVGVAIDTVEDMYTLFSGIPLNKISVNFTINSTAVILLSMMVVMAEEQGYSQDILRGTVQNDIIKEFLSRNTYIFSIEASLKIVGDIIIYAAEKLPQFNPIS